MVAHVVIIRKYFFSFFNSIDFQNTHVINLNQLTAKEKRKEKRDGSFDVIKLFTDSVSTDKQEATLFFRNHFISSGHIFNNANFPCCKDTILLQHLKRKETSIVHLYSYTSMIFLLSEVRCSIPLALRRTAFPRVTRGLARWAKVVDCRGCTTILVHLDYYPSATFHHLMFYATDFT